MRAKKQTTLTNNKKPKNIFISWSGENSKKIAKHIKFILEKIIFKNTGLFCFVSDINITAGADWYERIKKSLQICEVCIVCITKENAKAPWIHYEAGAMVAHDILTIPLLVACKNTILEGSPLKRRQCVNFDDQGQFIQMISDINDKMLLLTREENQLDTLSQLGYKQLKQKFKPIVKKLQNMRILNTEDIYPSEITHIDANTIFISSPMASIRKATYLMLRKELLPLKNILEKIGFKRIICPILNIEDPDNFDGHISAINETFTAMKQVDNVIVIYPQLIASSVLIEIGYAIALCKRIIIFYKGKLPFMLEYANGNIPHINTYQYKKFSEIKEIILKNGMDLFKYNSGSVNEE
jgi:hypothetical protein